MISLQILVSHLSRYTKHFLGISWLYSELNGNWKWTCVELMSYTKLNLKFFITFWCDCINLWRICMSYFISQFSVNLKEQQTVKLVQNLKNLKLNSEEEANRNPNENMRTFSFNISWFPMVKMWTFSLCYRHSINLLPKKNSLLIWKSMKQCTYPKRKRFDLCLSF